MAYLEQKFSFDDLALIRASENAIKYAKQNSDAFKTVTPALFLEDLRASVCMLQPDGLETAFVHRSFQEYFAALFVTDLHGPVTKKILDKYARRFGDSVIAMALDMDREAIEQVWVLPVIDELEASLRLLDKSGNNALRYATMFPTVRFQRSAALIFPMIRNVDAGIVGPLEAMCRMYPNFLGSASIGTILGYTTVIHARKIWLKDEYTHRHNYDKLQRLLVEADFDKKNIPIVEEFTIQKEDEWWINESGADKTFAKIRRGFERIRQDIKGRSAKRNDILEDFVLDR